MPKADPRTSAGARLERKAILAHVRRLMAHAAIDEHTYLSVYLEAWLLKRAARYDKAKGGLGKR